MMQNSLKKSHVYLNMKQVMNDIKYITIIMIHVSLLIIQINQWKSKIY